MRTVHSLELVGMEIWQALSVPMFDWGTPRASWDEATALQVILRAWRECMLEARAENVLSLAACFEGCPGLGRLCNSQEESASVKGQAWLGALWGALHMPLIYVVTLRRHEMAILSHHQD